MNRISIQTHLINNKQHVTVYLSDGITITERAGKSVLKTIIRTYVAHKIAQRKTQRQLTGAVASGSMQSSTSITMPNMRIERFKSRVDAGEGMAHHVTH